jgi:hypothetical protein
MEVGAVAIDNDTWRWRIVDGDGKIVAESDTTFPDIVVAVVFRLSGPVPYDTERPARFGHRHRRDQQER